MNGFSSGCSDEPLAGNRRVHREGREYYERNNKGNDWFTHDSGPGANTNGSALVHPEPRLRSEAARDIAQKNRGLMSESLGGYADPPPARTVHPRGVKPEAAGIAANNTGGQMKNLIVNYGNLGLSDRPQPKVKGSEAEEYKERERGSTKVLLDHYSTDPVPSTEQPKPPRLGFGAEEIADKHKGEGMGPLMRLEGQKTPREPKQGRLHQTSSGGGWDEIPPQSRMRPEGEGIATKNSADSMGDILAQDQTGPPQRWESKQLKHLEESHTPRSQPKMRVRLDGVHNMERARNQDEMSAIMHGSPTQQAPVARPGSGRVLPHLQRSELW